MAGLRGAVVALVEEAGRSGRTRAAEVAALTASPDYSPTLGAMARALEGIGTRLEGIEAQPALRAPPGQGAREVADEVRRARAAAGEGLEWAGRRLTDVVGELRRVVDAAREGAAQRRREWGALGIGAGLGLLLWWPLAWGLPWGLGDRLAATLVRGEGRWGAGATLMRGAEPETWARMVRLYNACPAESGTELCVAAMAVRTIAPGPGLTAATAPTGPAAPAGPAAPEGVREAPAGTGPTGAARSRAAPGR